MQSRKNTKIFLTFFGLVTIFLCSNSNAKLVEYNFDIKYQEVNFSGKDKVMAMTINGKIPGPIITATQGDILRVTVNNKMDVDSSIHWHGLLVPNDQDGVPYVNGLPIGPGESFTYQFPIIQSGSYWYHSHSDFQEQKGMFGGIIIYPKKNEQKKYGYKYDQMLILSDWTNEEPMRVLENLKRDSDYYSLKKDAVQSWDQVIKNNAIKSRIKQSLTRMAPIDLSDVGYDLFLVNGKKKSFFKDAKKSDKVRLRLVNAASSSYFNVEFSGGQMEVIATDGINIVPIKVDRLPIAVAETYDVIVSLPDNKQYELRATSIDGSGYSSMMIGTGQEVLANDIAKPNLFSSHEMMDMEGMDMSDMDMSHDEMGDKKILNYDDLKSIKKTTLVKGAKIRYINLELTGNMENYVWNFDNKPLSESDKILIKKGEVVRVKLTNSTMMSHPIHLHGHFFRLLNSQGDFSPLKHTIDVKAMSEVTIEFLADKEKDWIFHCHNLYHMESGMARIFHYQVAGEDEAKALKITNSGHHDNMWFSDSEMMLQTNMVSAETRYFNDKDSFNTEIEGEFYHQTSYEADLVYKRQVSNFLSYYAGLNPNKEKNKTSEIDGIIGIEYLLPLLIKADFRLNSDQKLSLELRNNILLTKHFNLDLKYKNGGEYYLGLNYDFDKNLSLVTNYNSMSSSFGVGGRVRW
jgi:FtsP/CotA-like multicopper oxidase with cupredoxin domain